MDQTEVSFNKLKCDLGEAQIAITFFTDPLCCWSWGMYSQLQQLLKAFGNRITVDYCMGGMIRTWDQFNDELLSIHKPAQMGPLWMQAAGIMNIPLNYMVWSEDPPLSSYPACLAVTAARQQSKLAAEKMLWMLSSAVMHHGQNISQIEVIESVAGELVEQDGQMMDLTVFLRDLHGKESRLEFKKDLEKVAFFKVERFPTLMILNQVNKKRAMTVGYRSYSELLGALTLVSK